MHYQWDNVTYIYFYLIIYTLILFICIFISRSHLFVVSFNGLDFTIHIYSTSEYIIKIP